MASFSTAGYRLSQAVKYATCKPQAATKFYRRLAILSPVF